MQFNISLTLLFLAVIAQGFRIPAGQKDGEYMVCRNKDGVEEHVPVVRAALPGVSPVKAPAGTLEKRYNYIYCGCGLSMNHGNCDAAVQNVKDQTRGGTITIQPNQSYYAIRGNVVAFICNKISTVARSTNAGIFGAVLADITNHCGGYVPGAAFNDNDGLIHGYQTYTSGTDFCGNWNKGKSGGC